MLHLEILCDPILISTSATYLARVAEAYGVSKHESRVLCFLAESVMEHRMLQLNENDPVLGIDVTEKNGRLVLSVTDKGLPYILTSNQKQILKAGHVRRFRFEQLGTDGQRLTLEFGMGRHYLEPRVPEPQKEELLDKNFSCRLTKDSDQDIMQVIRCIYYSYGYDYLHQEIYHTDEFKKMLHGGKYLSLLAENEHGQVVGHTALSEHDWFANMSELCNLVVEPIARGNNIANLLLQASLDLCEQKKLHALYGMPVMFHPISQKLLGEYGFVPCGMCFHVCPANMSKQYGDGAHRLDTAFAVRIREKQAMHTLYVPEESAAFVRDVFEREQVPYTVIDASQAEPAVEKGKMSYTVDNVSKKLEVKVDQVGRDSSVLLKNLPFEKDLEHMEMIAVYLNMNDPGCGICYQALRDAGYIFTGCLPGSADGDYLLLQHLMGQEIIKENLVTTPEYERMLEQLFAINGIA